MTYGERVKKKKTGEKSENRRPKKQLYFASLCMYEKWNSGKPTTLRTPKQYEIRLFSMISTTFSPRFRLKKHKNSMKSGAPGKPLSWRLSNTIDFWVGGKHFFGD